MTNEEKQLIQACRIMIIGTSEFINQVRMELMQLGFNEIISVEDSAILPAPNSGIIIESTGFEADNSKETLKVPVIYPFDFIQGAGAIVLLPDSHREFLSRHNIRLWVAEYMAGYCAFWNIEGCDWLMEAIPAIKEGTTSTAAQRTAALLCAKIAANIAVGRSVKSYPRFYLVENMETHILITTACC